MVGKIMKPLEDARQEGITQGMQRGLLQGRQEGRREGIQQGRMEREHEIIASMLRRKINPSIISEITGMPEEKIETLKNND